MKNICFIGAPGCGKSTQINKLNAYLSKNYSVFLGKATKVAFLEENVIPYLTEEERITIEERMEKTRLEKRSGNLADIFYDELLYKITTRIPEGSVVIFDGSPRSLERAELFLTQKHLVADAVAFHFCFPENEYENSISRQVFRGLKYNPIEFVKSEMDRFQRKIEIYQNDTLKGMELLKKNGVKIYKIDARESVERISYRIQFLAEKELAT